MIKNLIIALVVIIVFATSSPAQSLPNETHLALEIIFLQGRTPAYQQVSTSNSKKSGAWYALFGRVPGWRLPKGSLPIDAVRLTSYFEGETVKLRVSVLRGKFQEVEDEVASYSLRENEVIEVKELVAFGVEPFVIKLVRPSVNSELPGVVNKTNSVAVVSLEPMASTLPRYKLTLHNTSDKNLIAVSLSALSNGRVQTSSIRQNPYGEPVIEARETASLNQSLPVRGMPKPGGFEPLSSSAPQIVIESLVFEDGTYEGNQERVRMYLGFVIGRRTGLRRILPLLDEAMKDSNETSEVLRSQLAALSYQLDETELNSLANAFPKVNRNDLKISVEVAMQAVGNDLLDELRKIEKPDAFRSWLAPTHKQYSLWLSRVEMVNVSTLKPRSL